MQTMPETIALLRNRAPISVGASQFNGKPVFKAYSKSEDRYYELRGDASTGDHYAALVAEYGDVISKLAEDHDVEQCTRCFADLEVFQVGLCDDCQALAL
ncbi:MULTISPECIES: hypothetical protein [Pseudomonas]|uniref:Uncharacterized protein n=4 Tax=Pseudomonas TaxID=286 RepID=A0A3G1DGL9_PSEAI|nr:MULTISPECIES: hypothetical protein [Pseudomonas]AXQ51138.1 hypothetical protein DZC31_31155 [Stenotrophomonas rhizophila]MCO6692705.1 hypothetical protein [Pseudomonas shirazica]AMP35792.1 Hypothetical protein [Pseudomonas aeruginosa]ESW38594.1 hypothetical protein O164_17065 [Pseudomonas taiwanensis SJ9]KIC80930.1 hypothetical protein RR51_18455 [Pseudomonas sp. C5pp]